MGRIESLLDAYSRHVQLPWDESLAGPEKVWMIVYPPSEERRLRRRRGEFEIATKESKHGWVEFDLTDEFSKWLGAHEYRESYFEDPKALELAFEDFGEYLTDKLTAAISSEGVDSQSVFAAIGTGSLFGIYRASRLIGAVNDHVPGRLLIFFPGDSQGSNYRLLDAKDGFNYRAVRITTGEAI